MRSRTVNIDQDTLQASDPDGIWINPLILRTPPSGIFLHDYRWYKLEKVPETCIHDSGQLAGFVFARKWPSD